MIVLSITEFAAKRRGDQDDMEKDLYPDVSEALQVYPATNWYVDLLAEVTRLYVDTYHREGGTGRPPGVDEFVRSVRDTLEKTENPTDATADRLSVWLATAILNASTQEAAGDDEEFLLMEWVTMHDDDVRAAHKDTEGQQRPVGEPFDVSGSKMMYPGDPSAPIALWINCRCTLAPVLASEAQFRKTEGVQMTATETETEAQELTPLAWHGVLAPEGVWSGDGRQFAADSLRFRDLPLPLTWQKATDAGHDGSVVIGRIDSIERVDGMMNATGVFLSTVEADEVIALIAEFGKFGVSVDADDAEFEFDDQTDRVTFTSARIASASVVSIPAFAEAFIAIGPWAADGEAESTVDVCDQSSPDYDEAACAKKQENKPPEFSGMSAHTHSMYTTNGPTNHTHTINPRINWPAPVTTTPPVATLADLAPGKTEDGPGWLTHPVDTDRLRDYWTRGEGAAKIAWGTPGDFNRCRANLSKYVKPQYLSGYCANRHYDALGIWPGEHAGGSEKFEAKDGEKAAPALSLVAAGVKKAPAAWFANPNLTGPTHLTVTEQGQVYGHIAEWSACHIGYEGVCVSPPHSPSGYAYYATGRVLLDNGEQAKTGVLSLGGGHAAHRLSARAAAAHYDSTSSAVADVCVGEDDHGIWCAGWMRPGTTQEDAYALRASDVSGDWREISGESEMVAALAVNVGGFPTVAIEDGMQVSLVAAGVIRRSDDPIEELVAQVEARLGQRQARRERMKSLAARVSGGTN